MLDKIICIVGESGSGKTTAAEILEVEGFNYIKSYTTRKPRNESERGHIFVDDATYRKDREQDIREMYGMIAYTYYDGHHYWAMVRQYQNKGVSLYIIDPRGIKDIKKTVKDADIIVIYLKSDSNTRYKRMLQQRSATDAANRIFHDKKAFKLIECDYCIDANRSIAEVLEDIRYVLNGLS